jgi:hypothetical protein
MQSNDKLKECSFPEFDDGENHNQNENTEKDTNPIMKTRGKSLFHNEPKPGKPIYSNSHTATNIISSIRNATKNKRS